MKKFLASIIVGLFFIILMIMVFKFTKSTLYILFVFIAIVVLLLNVVKIIVSNLLYERYKQLYEKVRIHKEVPERY